MNYLYLLQLLAPEAIVLVAALAVLGLGLGPHRERRSLLLAVTLAGCVLAGLALAFFPQNASVLNGTAVLDPLTRLFKQVILLLSAITAVFARDSKVRANFAEYMALILFATIGMMLLAGTEELLTIFIALELTSLSLYVLTGFQTRDRASAEAALKYFLVGGISAGFLLFGLSLIYGVTGSTNLSEIARCLRGGGPMDPLLGAGMVMTLVGFGFKVAAVPFHLWAPDVYQGAPTSSAALVASGSKVAGFFVLSKVLVIALGPASGSAAWGAFRAGWAPLVALMAAFSIVLGNLAALAQNSVKRLLAYSAIAHAGYMLLALTVAGSAGVVILCDRLCADCGGRVRSRGRGRAMPGRRESRSFQRAAQIGAGAVPLHGGVSYFHGGYSAAGRLLRQVLSLCRRHSLVFGERRDALAGRAGGNLQCDLALLLLNRLEAYLRGGGGIGVRARRLAGVGRADRAACGVDRHLGLASGLVAGAASRRRAACEGASLSE